jgi:hypothetical protein
MNCEEIAATLEGTLIRERDPRWLHEARRHAAGCPSCARLLELHRLEEDLTDLPAVEPSRLLLESVMDRITQRESATVPSSGRSSYELIKSAAIFVGALVLASAYMVPAAGQSWLSNFWPTPGLSRTIGFSAYLDQHPLWAIHLAGLAALMIVLGLAVQDGPIREGAPRA